MCVDKRLRATKTGTSWLLLLVAFVAVLVPMVFWVPAAAARTVSVGVYQNSPGVFTDPQGTTQGFYIDILEAVAAKEGWVLDYVSGSWAEHLDRLQQGHLDLLVAIAYTAERAQRFSFNQETAFANWGQVYTGKTKIQSLIDLKGKRIAGLEGDIYADKFKILLNQFGIQHTFVELSEYRLVLQQVAEGKVDAGIVSRSNGLVNEKAFEVYKSPIVCCAMEIRYAAPLGKNTEILAGLDRHLAVFKRDQSSIYYQSLGRWFGGVGAPLFPEWVKWLLVGAVALLLLLVAGTVLLKQQVLRKTADLQRENAERKKAEEELKKSHDTLEQRVRERTEKLQKANQQLQSEIDQRKQAQEAVTQLSSRNEMILNAVGEGIYGMDGKGNATFFNPAAARMTGWLPEDLIDKNLHEILHHTRADGSPYPADQCQINLALKDGKTHHRDNELFWRKDGSSFPVEYISTPTFNRDQLAGVVVVFRDITARREEEARLTRNLVSRIAISALLETGLEALTMAQQLEVALDIILSVSWLGLLNQGCIYLTDQQTGELVMVSQRGLHDHLLTACARIKPGHCLCGRAAQTKSIIFSGCLDHRHEITHDGISEHGHYCVPILSKDQLLGVINLYLSHGHEENPEESAFLATVANTLTSLIERRQMEQQLKEVENQLRHTAHHDALTGLPNRRYLMDLLAHSVARSRRENGKMAVMFMDLDKFKQVNDTLGHDIGDLLLQESSKRIKACLRDSDILARLGGDEFMVVLSLVSGREETGLVGQRIIESLQIPFILKGKSCSIGSSIGIALFPTDGEEPEDLVKRADLAMYEVKENGRNHYRYYSPDMVEKGPASGNKG